MRIPGRRPFGNEGFLFHLANANYDSRPAAATSSHLPDPHFGCSGTQISEAKNPKNGGQKPRFSGSGGGQKGPKKGGGKFGTCTTPHPPHPWGGQGGGKIPLFFLRISVSAN